MTEKYGGMNKKKLIMQRYCVNSYTIGEYYEYIY